MTAFHGSLSAKKNLSERMTPNVYYTFPTAANTIPLLESPSCFYVASPHCIYKMLYPFPVVFTNILAHHPPPKGFKKKKIHIFK